MSFEDPLGDETIFLSLGLGSFLLFLVAERNRFFRRLAGSKKPGVDAQRPEPFWPLFPYFVGGIFSFALRFPGVSLSLTAPFFPEDFSLLVIDEGHREQVNLENLLQAKLD